MLCCCEGEPPRKNWLRYCGQPESLIRSIKKNITNDRSLSLCNDRHCCTECFSFRRRCAEAVLPPCGTESREGKRKKRRNNDTTLTYNQYITYYTSLLYLFSVVMYLFLASCNLLLEMTLFGFQSTNLQTPFASFPVHILFFFPNGYNLTFDIDEKQNSIMKTAHVGMNDAHCHYYYFFCLHEIYPQMIAQNLRHTHFFFFFYFIIFKQPSVFFSIFAQGFCTCIFQQIIFLLYFIFCLPDFASLFVMPYHRFFHF